MQPITVTYLRCNPDVVLPSVDNSGEWRQRMPNTDQIGRLLEYEQLLCRTVALCKQVLHDPAKSERFENTRKA